MRVSIYRRTDGAGPRVSCVAVAAAVVLAGILTTSGGQQADALKSAPTRPAIVPSDLPAWQISLSVNPQLERAGRHYRPTVEIDSGGTVTIKKDSTPTVTQYMEEADARELFGFLAEMVNRFYLTRSQGREYGPSHTNDLDETCRYRARVANGSRAVELVLEQTEPYRMELDSRFFNVIVGANRQLRSLQGRFPEPLILDESYRDPAVDAPRDIVPDRLSERWGVAIRIRSTSQKVELSFHHSGTEMLIIAVDGQHERHDALKGNVARVFYDCARLILNQFELRGGRKPHTDADARIELEMSQPQRSIRVEFEHADIPAEWRRNLADVIDISNQQIAIGKKIDSLGRFHQTPR